MDNLSSHGFLPQAEMDALVEKYQHPILKKYGEIAKEVGGHGGMDFIMDSRLVYCLQNGLPLDMDVYDLAEWCAPVSYTHLRAHETGRNLVCRLLLEKKKKKKKKTDCK